MKKYIFIVLVMFAAVGCKDYFEPKYTGNITEEDYYDNLNNLRFGLNAVYNVLQSKDYQVSELLFGEACSDNMWTSQDVSTGAVYDIVNFTFDTDNSYLLTRYQVNYEGINKANQVIRSIDRVKVKAIPATLKEIREVYGQAKVLRALFYFNLVRTFGGVSIQDETPQLNSLAKKRATEQETYAYIEKDLREALLLLRSQRYTLKEAGQISQGGALGLLLKVLLYEASPGIATSEDLKKIKWEQARSIGEFFIEGAHNLTYREVLQYDETTYGESWNELSKRLLIDTLYNLNTELQATAIVNEHGLLENYVDVFHQQGEFCKENLLEINHYSFEGAGSAIDEGWPLYDNMLNGGSPIFATASNSIKTLMAKDPRQMFTICNAQNKNSYVSSEGSPSFTKGVGDNLLYCKYYVFPSEGAHEGRNYRIMRYPEAMLIYAEVVNELGNSEKAVALVNKVRARARNIFHVEQGRFVTNVTEANFPDVAVGPKDVVRTAILNEKRIETCGEFDRWYEICRLNECSQCMLNQIVTRPTEISGKERIRGSYFKKGINERFPIPQKEVSISNGIIEQNPGY